MRRVLASSTNWRAFRREGNDWSLVTSQYEHFTQATDLFNRPGKKVLPWNGETGWYSYAADRWGRDPIRIDEDDIEPDEWVGNQEGLLSSWYQLYGNHGLFVSWAELL